MTSANKGADWSLPNKSPVYLASQLQAALFMKFPTEEDCFNELTKFLGGKAGKVCKECGSPSVEKRHRGRALRCRDCRIVSWISANTFFDGIKRSKAWLVGINLFEAGIILNSAEFCRLSGISYSSAREILAKIAMVMKDQLDGQELPSAELLPAVGKRSRLTLAEEPPTSEERSAFEKSSTGEKEPNKSAEQRVAAHQPELKPDVDSGPNIDLDPNLDLDTELEHQNLKPEHPKDLEDGPNTVPAKPRKPQRVKFNDPNQQMEYNAELILNLLSANPVDFDKICFLSELSASDVNSALTILEMDRKVTRLLGDRYTSNTCLDSRKNSSNLPNSSKPLNESQSKIAAELIVFLKDRFHAVSRKYLQLYVAFHYCLRNQSQWADGKLLIACQKFKQVKHRDLLAYQSPLVLRVAQAT